MSGLELMMQPILTPGAILPERDLPPLAAEDFAAYADASGDHNPLHVDPLTAHAAGFPQVIAHGMFVMGILSRLALELAGPSGLRSFGVRFRAPTLPGEALRCGGSIVRVDTTTTGDLVTLNLWIANTDGEQKAVGTCSLMRVVDASSQDA